MAIVAQLNIASVACTGVKTVVLIAGTVVNGVLNSLDATTGIYNFTVTDNDLPSAFVASVLCDGVEVVKKIVLIPQDCESGNSELLPDEKFSEPSIVTCPNACPELPCLPVELDAIVEGQTAITGRSIQIGKTVNLMPENLPSVVQPDGSVRWELTTFAVVDTVGHWTEYDCSGNLTKGCIIYTKPCKSDSDDCGCNGSKEADCEVKFEEVRGKFVDSAKTQYKIVRVLMSKDVKNYVFSIDGGRYWKASVKDIPVVDVSDGGNLVLWAKQKNRPLSKPCAAQAFVIMESYAIPAASPAPVLNSLVAGAMTITGRACPDGHLSLFDAQTDKEIVTVSVPITGNFAINIPSGVIAGDKYYVMVICGPNAKSSGASNTVTVV